jgi:hypothetical protein
VLLDLYSETRVRTSLSPAARTNGTVNGAAVDRSLFSGVMVVVQTGTITDGSHAITIEDSADGASGWAATAGQLQGSLPTVGAANDDTLFEVGVLGGRQFFRVVQTTTGATTGGIVGAVVVLGHPKHTPVSH